jgi:hypothetical protein
MLILRLPAKFISGCAVLFVEFIVVAPVEVGKDGFGRRKWGKECSIA